MIWRIRCFVLLGSHTDLCHQPDVEDIWTRQFLTTVKYQISTFFNPQKLQYSDLPLNQMKSCKSPTVKINSAEDPSWRANGYALQWSWTICYTLVRLLLHTLRVSCLAPFSFAKLCSFTIPLFARSVWLSCHSLNTGDTVCCICKAMEVNGFVHIGQITFILLTIMQRSKLLKFLVFHMIRKTVIFDGVCDHGKIFQRQIRLIMQEHALHGQVEVWVKGFPNILDSQCILHF